MFSLGTHLLSDTTGLFNILSLCGTYVETAVAGEVRWCYMPRELPPILQEFSKYSAVTSA